MKTFIRVNKDTNIVEFMYTDPFNDLNGLGKTEAELLQEGYLLDDSDIEKATNIPGKIAIPYYNSDTNKVYNKYENIPLLEKERIELLENALNESLNTNAKLENQMTDVQNALCEIFELMI